MKKAYRIVLILLICLLSLSGCGESDSKKVYSTYEELNGEKIGVVVGTVFDKISNNVLPDSEVVYYSAIADQITGLKEGKVEGFFTDYGVAVQACKHNDDLTYFSEKFDVFNYSLMFSKTDEGEKLRNAVNDFLESEKERIDFDQYYHQWANEDEHETFDYQTLPNINGTIRVATDGQTFPFDFVYNNQITGIEVEILYHFCEKEGYALQIDAYDFNGMLAAVSSGLADIGASGLASTKEREEKFIFTDCYLIDGATLVVRKDSLKSSFQSLADLSNTTVSCTAGSIYDRFLSEVADNITFQYYNSSTDEVNALVQGKVQACVMNSNVYKGFQDEFKNLRIIDSIYEDNIGLIFPKSDSPSKLQSQLDEFINSLKASGELEKIWDKWSESENPTIDYSNLEPINGTIHCAICSAEGFPINYIKDGKYAGIDIEVITRFAKEYGYNVEFIDYSFAGALAAVTSGKVDVGAANITISEERMESMNFSVPYYVGHVYVITVDENTSNNNTGFFDNLSDNLYKTFIKEDRYKLFLTGIGTTLYITISSCIFGTLLGFVLYFLFKNSNNIAVKLLNVYSWIISGLPTVVLLMIFYYVVFVKSGFSAETISIISFTILFSLAVFSILKTCFMAVDKGQYEAGYALGYSKTRTVTSIIIPEIAPMFFPSYRGEIVSLIKATSIVGYIAVQDLTKVSDIVRSRTYEAFFPLIAISIIYLFLSLVLDIISRQIEKRVNTKNRKIEDIMRGVKTK